MDSPLREVHYDLRQIQHHRFLQAMLYVALLVYGNVLYYHDAPDFNARRAVALGFLAISGLFFGIEVVRGREQTAIMPRLRNVADTVQALGASALYAAGSVYWVWCALKP